MPTISEVTIVLVEDNMGHARLIEKNLRRANLSNPIVKFADGQDTLDFFYADEGYANQSNKEPLLVLLDLNLPDIDGYHILERMKSDNRTKHIPIIILTTTDNSQEVDRCYALGCNVYITKPVQYQEFADAIAKLGLFLSVVKLPDGD